MILINDDCLILTRQDLSEFSDIIKGEAYDDVSRKMSEIIVEFLYDLWDRLEVFEKIIYKKISDKVIPIACVDMSETADFNKIDIQAVSEDSEFSITEKQKIIFLNLADKYFKSVKTLSERFEEAEREFE